jgi:hypothetical protein
MTRDEIIKSAPERIYLQLVESDYVDNLYGAEETWCQDKINDDDVEYVRGDIVNTLSVEVSGLQRVSDILHEVIATDDKAAELLMCLDKVERLRQKYHELTEALSDPVYDSLHDQGVFDWTGEEE